MVQIYDKITQAQLKKPSSHIKIIRNLNLTIHLRLLEGKGFKQLLNVFIDSDTVLHYTPIYGRSLAWFKQLVPNGANL